ncbi:MAG: EutN/CcmL family microcompartment protein [Synergistaceae bacterium]|jgi:ethanolamine utilization protein EutN|nr:EutN/CcmL family microcompartment protein [Synergistaceae bacterium]
MKLGKVIGSVVATRKHNGLVGHKLLIVRQVKPSPDGGLVPAPGGSQFIVAIDLVGAGPGELVLYTSGSSARSASTDSRDSPIDEAIVGIVDQTDFNASEVI